MPQLPELLERFRHAVAPGAPAAAGGVPADTAVDLESELRPLIAALDDVEKEVRTLVDAAAAEAAAVRERGVRDAGHVLDEARLQAARLRSAPQDAAAAEAADDGEATAIVGRAEAEAEAVRLRARSRIPGLVARVLDCVRGGAEPDSLPAREARGVAGVGRG